VAHGAQGSLRRAGSEARSFAIALGVICEKLCGGTNTNCEKDFGSCFSPDTKRGLRRIASWNMSCCASRGALLFCSNARPDSFYYSSLSVHAFAVTALALRGGLRLPIYADLFDIFFGSGGDAWRSPRKLVGTQASCALPTVGGIRVRPGTVAEAGRTSE
jgi:hypothetical protein